MDLKNKELQEYLENLLGENQESFLNAPAEPRSIRLNTLKVKSLDESPFLKENNEYLKKVAFSDIAFTILDDSIPFSQSLDFFSGNFSFQGASSQIPPLVLNPLPGEKVLDMAASPGSKTTQIATMMNNTGQLIVNDSNINRMQALNSNTQRTGMINHCVYYLAGERIGRLFPEYFDKVLLDAPCTGLGTLAKNREVYSWWSYAKLKKLVAIQKQLFVSAIKSVKVGGEIVYSTCSIAPEENEMILNDILESYPVEIVPVENKRLDFLDNGFSEYKEKKFHSSMINTKRVWPQKNQMEGFFIARIIKKETYYNMNNPKKVEFLKTLSPKEAVIESILENISENWGIPKSLLNNYRYIKTRNRLWMFAPEILQTVKEGYTNGGLLLAEERQNIWKLSNQSAQFFKESIQKRIILLPLNELKELFENGFCSSAFEKNGYFTIKINNEIMAVVYINNGLVKMKLPHPFRV